MNKMAIIADDLSGANDAGSQALLSGYSCCSLNYKSKLKIPGGIEIPIINSSSRMLPKIKAYIRTKSIAGALFSYELLYKKTDSTLRGNIGAEIDACIDGIKADRAAFIPAFPALQRRSVYGRVFLGKKVIENTEFASDAFNPVTSSNLTDLIKKQSKYKPVLVDIDILRKGTRFVQGFMARNSYKINARVPIYIFDCLSNKDLKIAAKCLKDFKVIAGASGPVGYLLKKKTLNNFYKKETVKPKQAVFIGSMKRITHEQLILLNKYISRESRFIKPVLFAVNTPGKNTVYGKKQAKRIDRRFAKAALLLTGKNSCGKLILSGGATAENICKVMKINITLLIRNILTGIPLTYSPERNIYIVTKPGGYGDKKALVTIYKALKEL